MDRTIPELIFILFLNIFGKNRDNSFFTDFLLSVILLFISSSLFRSISSYHSKTSAIVRSNGPNNVTDENWITCRDFRNNHITHP